MNREQDPARGMPSWSSSQQSLNDTPNDAPDPSRAYQQRGMPPQPPPSQYAGPYSGPTATSVTRLPERTPVPTRAQTLGESQSQLDRPPPLKDYSRSEDLNHSSSSSPPSILTGTTLTPSHDSTRSSSPTKRRQETGGSSQGADTQSKRTSRTSFSSAHSGASLSSGHGDDNAKPPPPAPSSVASSSLASSSCSACGKPMQGPFVRALGTVFHLNCFKCMDCGDVVASKFFPIEGPDGKQSPLCERDYFRRLNLICAKCGMALRGSYITACNKKFHVEHFTCSLCSTLFGPQDSYYEHGNDVYCHFHYSTRFATKCVGCNSAILKQFVEINRNMKDECWHPECYMINKFWNVKVVTRRPSSSANTEDGQSEQPAYVEEEARETPASLKEKQARMEQQVYRIWTVLSAFEESSAACISDMLRQVSNGQYLDAIRMAEKFILHVEVLFATIDDLEWNFAQLGMKSMSHVREARMLCRKTVELFTLLSHTQETGSRRMGMTQDLLALVTGLAHYLKILIRIALTGALKLERDQSIRDAMSSFLDKLHLLAVQGGNPSARRLIKGHNGEVVATNPNGNFGTQGVTYGFRSLAPENAGDSPFSPTYNSQSSRMLSSNPPSDLCVKCGLTVEEDCVRLGTYQRWHSHCIQCAQCGKVAAVPVQKEQKPVSQSDESSKDGTMERRDAVPKLSTARRPPANVGMFVYEAQSMKETSSFGLIPTRILCTDHAHEGCRGGFQAVQRLEQYAFLLNVALRRLYLMLRKAGVVPLSPETPSATESPSSYRNSNDVITMKSAHLDRKLSATARLPKRSTIVESPTGKSVHPHDAGYTNRSPDPSQPPLMSQAMQLSQQGHVMQRTSPHHTPSPQPSRPHLGSVPGDNGQILRPSFARANTEVKIVDDSAPSSPAAGMDDPQPRLPVDDSITLADIPQIVQAAQLRSERRSLPRENAIPYIAELSPLELAIIKHAAVLALSRSPLQNQFDLDEILELVEVKKGGFWNKLFKGDKKNVKKKGVFGIPLEFLVEREGVDSLLGSTRATMRVPSFVDDVISAMRQMDLSIEGIFRKNGNIKRLRDLTEAIDRDPASVDLTQENAVQLAALLKKFLRDLPDPLMTFKLHRLFIASQSLPNEADRHRILHMVCLILPKSHRDTLEVLFVFLKWVASFAHMDEETGSKMDLGNLATVICPSILYSRGRDPVRDESFGAIRVVSNLLENQDDFFAVPEEFLPMLRDQDHFSAFLKKCDTYQRAKSGRPPAAQYGSPPNGMPRYNGIATPTMQPTPRPYPAPVTNSPYTSPSSPSIPQNGFNHPREDWPASPRMPSVAPHGAPSSRPSSYVQPRPPPPAPSSDQLHGTVQSANGYPSAVRQRTQ
ncbi:hypothetical protein BD626DRAFT_503621 [Schizophyllum amplum]|uniref:RhoGAP-domain-containing protein n=1 Tax=Schizophyllum amplum TaxID=97359 RepID=A0A550C7F0_9AGAR|nr:hypothetical protein BD626DRAFT_503621 [Auriculariopsis ampla]